MQWIRFIQNAKLHNYAMNAYAMWSLEIQQNKAFLKVNTSFQHIHRTSLNQVCFRFYYDWKSKSFL